MPDYTLSSVYMLACPCALACHPLCSLPIDCNQPGVNSSDCVSHCVPIRPQLLAVGRDVSAQTAHELALLSLAEGQLSMMSQVWLTNSLYGTIEWIDIGILFVGVGLL